MLMREHPCLLRGPRCRPTHPWPAGPLDSGVSHRAAVHNPTGLEAAHGGACPQSTAEAVDSWISALTAAPPPPSVRLPHPSGRG